MVRYSSVQSNIFNVSGQWWRYVFFFFYKRITNAIESPTHQNYLYEVTSCINVHIKFPYFTLHICIITCSVSVWVFCRDSYFLGLFFTKIIHPRITWFIVKPIRAASEDRLTYLFNLTVADFFFFYLLTFLKYENKNVRL